MTTGPRAPAPAAGPVDGDARDRELMAAHVAGDAAAFGELASRHRDRLWAVALRTLGDREEASDALQDALLSAYRNAASYRGEARVTTWLHRVVVNACLDRLRSAKIRRLEALPDDVEDRGTLVATAQHDDQPEAAAEDAERRRRVLDALATLPADQRAALVLVDMEGYPVAEVAVMLDCAEGTVKSRCSRGRAKLAGLLADLHRSVGDVPHGNPPPDGPVQPTVRPRGPPAP